MRSSTSVAVACLAASVSAHGVVTKVTGANGVEMPGLTGKFSYSVLSSGSLSRHVMRIVANIRGEI